MQRLANFSIETDNMVLLQYAGGQELRVPVGQLAGHLIATDLDRVTNAIRLRQDFLRIHMPRVGVLALIGTGVVAFWLAGGGQAVARLINPPESPRPAPVHDRITHNMPIQGSGNNTPTSLTNAYRTERAAAVIPPPAAPLTGSVTRAAKPVGHRAPQAALLTLKPVPLPDIQSVQTTGTAASVLAPPVPLPLATPVPVVEDILPVPTQAPVPTPEPEHVQTVIPDTSRVVPHSVPLPH